MTFFWLVGGKVTGWCPRDLGLSLVPSSTWVGAFVPAEKLKVWIFLEKEPSSRFNHYSIFSWLFLLCFCISSLSWLALSASTLWNSRKVQGAWRCYPAIKKQGTLKVFVPRRPHRGPAPGPRSSRDLEKRRDALRWEDQGRLHVGSSIWAHFWRIGSIWTKGDTFQTERKSRRRGESIRKCELNLDGGKG